METLDQKPSNLDSLLSALMVLCPWPNNNLGFYLYKKVRKPEGLDEMVSNLNYFNFKSPKKHLCETALPGKW